MARRQSTDDQSRQILLQSNGTGHERPAPRLTRERSDCVFVYAFGAEAPAQQDAQNAG